MLRTIEVEIDDDGRVRAVEDGVVLPTGRATLVFGTAADVTGYIMSEMALAQDWLRPEEDAAWEYLQPRK